MRSIHAAAVLATCGLAASAVAYVEFVHTNGVPYSGWTGYVSAQDMGTNTGGTAVGTINPPIAAKDSFFTDGTYFYRVTSNGTGDAGQYNNLIVRYQSLAELDAGTGGEVFPMNGYGMYYDDEIFADNVSGRFFRTTRYFPDGSVTVGMYAYNSFAELVNNQAFYASGFSNGPCEFDCQFWAWDGKFYRTNVSGATGSTTVTGINVYNSSEDLYNGVVAQTVPVTAGYAGSTRFFAIDSSLLPAPSCQGDLDGDGFVTGADLGLLLANWGACPQ